MSYGTSVYGTSIYSRESGVEAVSTPLSDESYNISIDFPLRFSANCDIAKTNNKQSVLNNSKLSVMVVKGGIPLREHLGSRVPLFPFDPSDDALRALIGQEAADAIRVGEPRAKPDTLVRMITSTDGNTYAVAIPIAVLGSLEWENMLLELPVKTDM